VAQSSPKMRAVCLIFKIATLREQSPIGRKFAKSGHPGTEVGFSQQVLHLSRKFHAQVWSFLWNVRPRFEVSYEMSGPGLKFPMKCQAQVWSFLWNFMPNLKCTQISIIQQGTKCHTQAWSFLPREVSGNLTPLKIANCILKFFSAYYTVFFRTMEICGS
jgi:hypothetical protein